MHYLSTPLNFEHEVSIKQNKYGLMSKFFPPKPNMYPKFETHTKTFLAHF